MVSKALLFVGLGVLAVLPAACAGPVGYYANVSTTYGRHDVLYATKDGPLAVETFGRVPSEQALEGEALQRYTADVLDRYGPHWFVGGFVSAAEKDPPSPYRVRLLFNVPQPFPYVWVCADEVANQAANWTEETGRVVIAFCLDDVALSSAEGSYGPPGTRAAGAVPQLVGMMARDILPPGNPDRDRDNCRLLNCS